MSGRDSLKLANISIGTKDSHMMNAAVRSLVQVGLNLDFRCFNASDLDDDPLLLADAMDFVSGADLVTIKVHGDTSYFKKFERMRGAIDANHVCALLDCTDESVTASYRGMFSRPDEDYARCLAYMVLGGDDNFKSLVLWSIRTFDGLDLEVPDPVHPPAQGLYYPGRESIDIDSYVGSLPGDRPNIGIFFYQKQWLTGNTHHIDALIREIEGQGGNPVPIFMYASENKVAGAIGTKRLLREHLTRDGGPVLHSIIETMSFSQTLVANPGEGEQVSEDNFFLEYGVPVIQTMTCCRPADEWREDTGGLLPSEIAYDVAHPEFDGQIVSVACASTERDTEGSLMAEPLEERPGRVVDTAMMWARLRMTSDPHRRVAILLYMYPPKTANAGGASGLDTFQSVVDLLHRMRDDGYYVGDDIPETSRELVDILLAGITNDMEWSSEESIRQRAADLISPEWYGQWYSGLSEAARGRIEEGWGRPPGDFYTVGKEIVVPGVLFGNVLVGFQPDRGRDIQSDYHNPDAVMPHQYLAYYRWLRHVFGADAVIHVGTHGTLEWLPGKGVAMSGDCCPDYVMDSLPDIYPYIIGNPGEGTQAKRRASAVIIDHMIPSMMRSGSYDDIQEVEGAVQNYMSAVTQGQQDKAELIRVRLREAVGRMELYNDLKLSPMCTDEEFDARVDDLYDYIMDVKENLIKDGLHILGDVPEGDRLDEMIYSLTRLDNGEVPSLRGSIAMSMGYGILDLLNDASSVDPVSGMLKGQILDDVEGRTDEMISDMHSLGFDPDGCRALAEGRYPDDNGDLLESVSFICGTLYPSILRMGDEIDSVMDALRGRYIEPGPSGCPTRGRAQLLPTGRNFYSLDPDAIPWHSSWEVGRRMADQMLDRYVLEHGTYPRAMGMVVWATDTMKTGGDDIGYILWLMGLRPVWTGYAGRVMDLEVIPVSELGRPRIDVTLRISGLFRDTFPNLVNLLDRGVRTIADLDESDDENCLRANLRQDIARSIAEGVPEDEARDEALIRIFGDAPGTYGSGTNILIRTSDWHDVSDIGAIYRSYGEYAYGVGRKGKRSPEAFRRRLELMEVTVKNSTSREYDMFDNDDVYNDLGGMNAAVRAVSGRMPMSFIGCSADTSNLRTRTIDEEGRYVFRSKINNLRWVEGLKRHGFKGAEEISNMAEYVFGWDATSDIVDPWMYQSIADNFLFDEGIAEWFEDANPHAMHDTVSRLLEAIGRDMWSPAPDVRERLEHMYLDLESRFEGEQ